MKLTKSQWVKIAQCALTCAGLSPSTAGSILVDAGLEAENLDRPLTLADWQAEWGNNACMPHAAMAPRQAIGV